MVAKSEGGVFRRKKWGILTVGERLYSVEKLPPELGTGDGDGMNVQINITVFADWVRVLLRIYGCFIDFMGAEFRLAQRARRKMTAFSGEQQ
jgi:hypothetical protein